MPAAKPTTARRPPARAPIATALLDFDDEEEEGALPVADPALEAELEPDPELELEPGVPDVPLADEALAAAWNASKDLFCVGLMAKTMPSSQ
jgi:hypothetical protein